MILAGSSSSSAGAAQQSFSRPSILDKLDALALKLSNSNQQFRTHKYFRVNVPQGRVGRINEYRISAITGQSLVQLIHECLPNDDSDQQGAVHLATILLHYGYIFPVIEQSLQVKDDNTLYRRQLPYFWPSQHISADNVEYSIYLTKRLMRSEQRHGLEEDEVEAYNRNAELLGHMWDFITTQAEMQLKIQKERKKIDKVVFDSEERAFWRLRRPGHPNALDEHIRKVERKLRKPTLHHYRLELERLKLSLKTKPWLKALKASETMVSWCEQFHDFDPFITTCQPTNPWTSDDISLWVLNADNVEVPTERRVKRWGLGVQELVRDPIGRQVLETFLDSEFSSENIRFCVLKILLLSRRCKSTCSSRLSGMAVCDLKYSPNNQVECKAQRVHEEFLAPGAPCQVNVDSRTLEETYKRYSKCIDSGRRHAFSLAEEHVFTLMSKDSYPRFLRSPIYKGVLSAAQQQGTRRVGWRNFVFNQKKTPVPSKHKMSRDDNSHSSLPKQLSSDSLPVKVGILPQGAASLHQHQQLLPPIPSNAVISSSSSSPSSTDNLKK